jgi:hypothetical protein
MVTVADEPEQADAVALVLAHLRGDEQVIEALLAAVEPRDLFAATVGLLVNQLLAETFPGGLDGLERTLVDWQQQRRESL